MTYKEIQALYAKHGFPFECDPYKPNIYGRRSADLVTVDKFNDIRGMAYLDSFGNEMNIELACTTKPGLAFLGKTMGNPNGTGILIPGFYKDCWKLGVHNDGKPTAHRAFVQVADGVFKVWRDNDKDGHLDFSGKVYTDDSDRGSGESDRAICKYFFLCFIPRLMYEALIAFGGLILGISTMLVRESIRKGREQVNLETVMKDVEDLKKEVSGIKEELPVIQGSIDILEQGVNRIKEDHTKIDETVEKLNSNLHENNRALSSLDATMKGVQNLLQNIFDGNLAIRKSPHHQ
jgi:prefoldin subunit 5